MVLASMVGLVTESFWIDAVLLAYRFERVMSVMPCSTIGKTAHGLRGCPVLNWSACSGSRRMVLPVSLEQPGHGDGGLARRAKSI